MSKHPNWRNNRHPRRRMRKKQKEEMSPVWVSHRESVQGDEDAAKKEGGTWNREDHTIPS
jgi:hypothetical protein